MTLRHRSEPMTGQEARDDEREAPWDDPAGCFGHCDREGWHAPCRRQNERDALVELDRIEEYAEQHGHPAFQDEGSAFLAGARWATTRKHLPDAVIAALRVPLGEGEQ